MINDSLKKCEIERCNVTEPLNADVCKESRRDKCKITKQRGHRRIRDRERSRIPVIRVLRKLKKRTTRHRLKCCVLNSLPCTSFMNRLCKNYENRFLWYNTEYCYFKYVSFLMAYKCKSKYPNGCSYRNVYSSITETKSVVRHRDISDNGSTLRGGMPSKNSSCKSAWACLNDRFARLSLEPYDVGENGDCFFKSVSRQLYKTADFHFEIRKAGIQHLNNHPEYFIESISDNNWQSYIQQMSTSGTWCDNTIIQAVSNSFNCIIHIT